MAISGGKRHRYRAGLATGLTLMLTACALAPPVPSQPPRPAPRTVTPTVPRPTDPGAIGRCGATPTRATRELRGMWLATVTNLDFPSRGGLTQDEVMAEFRGWLDLARQFNHNAIFVQVRPTGDAFWPSAYAPWSQWLTGRLDGTGPGWDPLAEMIAETHARGLEFHAWFNPFRGAQRAEVGGPGADWEKLAPNHPLLAHRDWAVIYPKGDEKLSAFYFDPGIPDARRFVQEAILEAVANYDLDAVHFDDFFYPYPVDGQDFDDSASFARYGTGGKAAWRRANINSFVREVGERIKQVKPWVKFGISPFGIWKNAKADGGAGTRGLESYHAIYADTRTWVREGWVDYIVPQLYWQIGYDRADYAALLPWWADVVKGTSVQLYIGQADYRVGTGGAWDSPDELSKQLALARTHDAAGFVHFRATSLGADTLGAQTRYREKFYASVALVPTMDRLPATAPATPQGLVATSTAGLVTLQWEPVPDAAHYAVYRVDRDLANLVGQVASPSFTGPSGSYCVSALDRSWNEGPTSAAVAAG
ncbi:MAG: family 10 glycosylhydrolase [Propionicimonas sp.]